MNKSKMQITIPYLDFLKMQEIEKELIDLKYQILHDVDFKDESVGILKINLAKHSETIKSVLPKRYSEHTIEFLT